MVCDPEQKARDAIQFMKRPKPRSDNSEKHPYTRHSFWINRENWFWESPIYTDQAREYYHKFVNEQLKIAERKALP